MADVQGVITLGLGPTTGSDIEHFILVGLNATGVVASVLTPMDGRIVFEPTLDGHLVVEPVLDGTVEVGV